MFFTNNFNSAIILYKMRRRRCYFFSVSGTVSYQWRKAGTNIIGANSSTYSIPSIASTDVGNYDVVVTCVCGANPITTSNLVSLTVNSSPTISGTTSTTVGGNTTLTGSIAPGTWSSGTL